MGQRLPDASAFGAREQLQSRSVIGQDPSREGLAEMRTGQAITNLGQTVSDIGQRIQEREDRLSYVKGESEFIRSGVETENSFESDTDYKTYGSRYFEKMQKAKQDASAKIQSPYMREQFLASADLNIQQGLDRMAKKSRELEKSNGLAVINETVNDSNRELYINAKDDATRVSALNNSKQAIEIGKVNGWMSPEDAEEMGRKLAQDYAVARVSVLPPDERIAVLNQKGVVSDFIPTDMKMALIEKAESESISNLRNLEWQAQQNRETLFNESSLQVEQTGSVSNITPERWASMDKGQREALTKYARDIAEGNNIATDWGTYYQLKSKAADPSTRKLFEREDLTKYRTKLGPTEYKELIGTQATLREGKSDKQLDGYLTKTQIVNDSLAGIGIDPSPKPGKQAKEVADFRRMVDERQASLQTQTGKEATNEEVQKIVDTLIVKGRVPNTGIIWNDQKRRYQLKSGEHIVVEDVNEVPPSEREKIEAALRNRNRPLNDQTILDLYNQKLAREL